MLAHVLAYQNHMDKAHLEIPHAHIKAVSDLMDSLRVSSVPETDDVSKTANHPPVIKMPRVRKPRNPLALRK